MKVGIIFQAPKNEFQRKLAYHTRFFIRKRFIRNEFQNLKKMLKKSPVSNVYAAIFKNIDFY